MGRTLTNSFSLQYAIEASIGVLPGSPSWKSLEPNEISKFGAEITTVPRNPISKNRQRKKGAITDLNSGVEFSADLTMDSFIDFIEGFCFSNFVGPLKTTPSAATTTAFTVPTMSAALPTSTLVLTRGFLNTANNGLKVVTTGGTTTSIPITGGGLTAETPAATRNVTLEVAGFRFAAGDLQVNASGNLVSTTKDFTELNLQSGQAIWVGGSASANQFAVAANTGFARVVSVAAHLITLDKKATTFATDDGATKLVDLLFGRFVKNVDVDDAQFLERSFHFEGAYQNLANPSGDEYEYSKGNFCNEIGLELPLTDKATLSLAFVGTDTDNPTVTRATGASTPRVAVQTGAFNTSADIARLRITEFDETGLTTDFKSLNLSIKNNVGPEKVLGTLGARYMNAGNLEIGVEAQLLFTNSGVVAAIKDNETVTMDFSIKNDDGGIFFDIPSMTLGGGGKDYPVNESILINTTASAFGDTTFGSSIHISLFPYLP